VFVTAGVASAQNQAQIDHGQKVFTAQKCTICHSIAGQGNKKGALTASGRSLGRRGASVDCERARDGGQDQSRTQARTKAYATLGWDDL
jgi:cytochrome c2